MTDGRHPTPGCLDAETLAAFMDGRLEPRERAAVEAHMADCEECYEVWMEASQVGASAAPARWVSRTLVRWSVGLASAAAIVLYVAGSLGPGSVDGDPVTTFARATGSFRLTEARLSEPFGWSPRRDVTRGEQRSRPSAEILLAAARLRQSGKPGSDGDGLRARGLAALAEGNLDAAIGLLTESVRVDPRNVNAHADLSAVLLERHRQSGDPADAALSLQISERGLALESQSGPLLFNRGLALEATGAAEQAVAVWRALLESDPNSPWAGEVAAKIRR